MFFKRKCKITFIKHGATINTEENRFFDDESFPAINETGRLSIEKIAQWISNKGLKVDRIYSSSALRCVQSARIIADKCHQDFEVLNNLQNRKSGVWNNLSLEQIQNLYPEQLQQYYKNAENFKPEGAETLIDFNKRVDEVIQNIIDNNLHKRLIIVTHGEVIQAAIANAIGLPLNSQFKTYIPSGSATQISYFEDWASLIYSAQAPL